jgi:hypothetical protein
LLKKKSGRGGGWKPLTIPPPVTTPLARPRFFLCGRNEWSNGSVHAFFPDIIVLLDHDIVDTIWYPSRTVIFFFFLILLIPPPSPGVRLRKRFNISRPNEALSVGEERFRWRSFPLRKQMNARRTIMTQIKLYSYTLFRNRTARFICFFMQGWSDLLRSYHIFFDQRFHH